jgi:hypothetical protein
MQKIQSIMCLFCFLIVLFSLDLLFGNPLRETFKGIQTTNTNKNIINDNESLNDNNIKSDDEPLNFGFLAK